MKLVRYGRSGHEKPGMIDSEGALRDLSAYLSDITPSTICTLDKLKPLNERTLPLIEGNPRLGPCVGEVGKLMCIGLNYSDHAAEAGMNIPDNPILFMKANSAINGPYDDVFMPRGSVETDWEVELGVIIGVQAKYVVKECALDYVAGYCVINDISERSFQTRLSGQWTKGKSCDGFAPIGPWFVTSDEISDPQNLSLTLDVNGTRMQNGTTATMIFSVCEIIEHLSSLFTLYPGDIIATGTPPGVGMGIKPTPRYLQIGDVMEAGIQNLGVQRQRVLMDD